MLYYDIITSRIKYLFRKIMAHFYPKLIQHRCEEEENEVDEKSKTLMSCIFFRISAFSETRRLRKKDETPRLRKMVH